MPVFTFDLTSCLTIFLEGNSVEFVFKLIEFNCNCFTMWSWNAVDIIAWFESFFKIKNKLPAQFLTKKLFVSEAFKEKFLTPHVVYKILKRVTLTLSLWDFWFNFDIFFFEFACDSLQHFSFLLLIFVFIDFVTINKKLNKFGKKASDLIMKKWFN